MSDPTQPVSRRQRLLGIARATRDTYIPRLTDSVSSIASGVSARTFGAAAGSNSADMYDANGNLLYPKDTTLTLFPSYTRLVDGVYHIDVRGWLSCPGVMTRKNRLMISLARQITRYNSSPATSTQAVSKIENPSLNQDVFVQGSNDNDTDSIVSSASSRSDPDESTGEDLIKQRLACFIARAIPNAQLQVVVGFTNTSLKHHISTISTDQNGHFDLCINTDDEPSFVQVKTTTDETIFAFQDILVTPSDGVGVISDIDDTVKLTGVIGDKRELMTNLLLRDVSSWTIPSVIRWYNSLYHENKVSFHYVSNSPWQLFNTIQQYFKVAGVPVGSIHLKQYTGNIISSLLEPSSSRKKRSLAKILADFPKKSFICVGDSGEYDLEAYVDLAKANPGRVAAIYIRVVQDSLSDVDDNRILKEISRLLGMASRNPVAPPKPSSPEIENLIDLSDSKPEFVKKLPPMVPKKPSTLKGNNVERPPPLPQRTSTLNYSDKNMPGGFPGREYTESAPDSSGDLSYILNTNHYFDLEEMDPKGALWVRKIVTSLQELKGTGTEIRLFTDNDGDFVAHCAKVLKNHLKHTTQ